MTARNVMRRERKSRKLFWNQSLCRREMPLLSIMHNVKGIHIWQ